MGSVSHCRPSSTFIKPIPIVNDSPAPSTSAMTESDSNDVVNTQALTQQVDVSALQADIDSMQQDDDADSVQDREVDDENDAQDADEHHSPDSIAHDEPEDDRSREQLDADANDEQAPSTEVQVADGKLKRPPSAYFLFCADKRAEVRAELTGLSVTAVAKALGERWRQLTLEQKQQYEQTAKAAKATYTQQQQQQQQRKPNPLSASTDQPVDPLALVLPLSHIKRILHKDPAHSRLTKQAALALSYAVQLFVLDLSRRCWLRVRGGKRRVVRMEEVVAVVEGGVGLEWLRGEMRRMAKEMEKVREAEKKKREEERERNKENDPAASNSADAPQPTHDDTESREGEDGAEAEAEAHKEVAEQREKAGDEAAKKKTKRKAGKAEIDVKQYKSITTMFSRMQQIQQQKQQDRVQPASVEEEGGDEVEEVYEVEDEDGRQVDKRQRTTEQSELGVEELSDVEDERLRVVEEEADRVDDDAELEDAEAVTVSQRSKRRTAILDDDDDIDDV